MHYKQIAYFIILLFLLISINNLVHSIYTTWEKQNLIKNAQEELSKTTAQNQHLKQEVARVNKPNFIESEARDKLLLTKDGENIVVIPTTASIHFPTPTPIPVDTTPNWEKWLNVFF